MAQMYRFTDANGEVRLMAEIDPSPGGAQPSVELVGPFSLTHSSPGLDTQTGLLLTTLDQAQIILAVRVFITETWSGSGGLYFFVGDGNFSPLNLWVQTSDPVASAYSANPLDGGIGSGTATGLDISAATDGGVYAQAFPTGSAGAATIYLLVSAA